MGERGCVPRFVEEGEVAMGARDVMAAGVTSIAPAPIAEHAR